MSYAHILGSMYEHSSCMIIFFIIYDQCWSWPLSWSLTDTTFSAQHPIWGFKWIFICFICATFGSTDITLLPLVAQISHFSHSIPSEAGLVDYDLSWGPANSFVECMLSITCLPKRPELMHIYAFAQNLKHIFIQIPKCISWNCSFECNQYHLIVSNQSELMQIKQETGIGLVYGFACWFKLQTINTNANTKTNINKQKNRNQIQNKYNDKYKH